MFSSRIPSILLSLFFCFTAVITAVSQKAESTPQGTPLKKCWTSPVDQAEVRQLYSDAVTIYAATSDGKLRGFRRDGGATVWTVEIGGEFVSNIVAAGDDLLIASNTSGAKRQSTLRSISKQTGIVHWRAEVPFSDRYFLGGVNATELAAVGSAGVVIGVSLENGATSWKADVAEVATTPSFANGAVLVASSSKRVYSISQAERGRIVLNLETKWKPTAAAFFDGGKFALGDERGNVAAYRSDGSLDWKFKNGARISHLTHTQHGLLAASNDNFIYMLTGNRGGVIWKRRLSGRIALEPVIVAEALFVVTYGDGRGYLIDLEKGRILDQTTASERDFTPLSVSGSNERISFQTPTGLNLYSTSGC